MERYNFKTVESKWQSFWSENNSFKVKRDNNKKKFYCLEMFPYPSGKIHMGHVRNYTIGDVLSRYKKMQGYNVLHPMGWDSFGMPAEIAARENNLDPKIWTEKNISVMKNQLKKLGLSIDWDREISTCSEDYYKHQQLFFLELFDKGLVYRKENYVNWDPVDETVLANEQVIDGKGWRSGANDERKKLNPSLIQQNLYNEDFLKTAGVFAIESGFDNNYLFTSLGFAQNLFNKEGEISSYEIMVENKENIETTKQKLKLTTATTTSLLLPADFAHRAIVRRRDLVHAGVGRFLLGHGGAYETEDGVIVGPGAHGVSKRRLGGAEEAHL